ncbi:MAG: peptidoglycan editing factor PgeF [Acidobacteriota bacterium]|nr:peptidoglycan editing factor PgeF [Acidobacteriota bacterium]
MVEVTQVPEWQSLEWLCHGFSTRNGGLTEAYGRPGELNLSWTPEDGDAHVRENRARLIRAAGGEGMALVTVRQVHADGVYTVDRAEDVLEGRLQTADGRAVVEADGLITDQPGILLGIQTADCVPVIVVDPVCRRVGVFHAGWRGTVAGIAGRGVALMAAAAGAGAREQMLAAIGPSIGPCCYAVGDSVRAEFCARFAEGASLFPQREGQLHLDLWEANRCQLLEAGLADDKITVLGHCTGCRRQPDAWPLYFSHRMERGKTGRIMNVAGIRAKAARRNLPGPATDL